MGESSNGNHWPWIWFLLFNLDMQDNLEIRSRFELDLRSNEVTKEKETAEGLRTEY